MNLMTDPSTQYKDGKMVIPELPKKTGYKNDGLWHDDHGHTYAAGTEVTVTDEMKQNGFNLHVNWEPITYTVKFDVNGGSGTMEDLTMTYDEAAALPTKAFTSGTKFIGWSLSKTGSVNFKDGAMVRNLSETDGDTVTLYALWKQNKFKVTYDANGGYFGTDTSKISNTVTYQNERQLIRKTSKTDNVNEDGSGYSGSYGNNVNKTEVVTIPGAKTLKVTITYQTESTNYDWVCMWEGAHPKYTAENNYDSSKTRKLGGTKTTKEYTVTGDTVTFGFHSDYSGSNYFGYYAVVEGEGIASTVKNGTFMQPSHLEKLFVGWYTDAACTDGHEFSLDCESDITVYAKWKDPTATLKDGSALSNALRKIAVNKAAITAFKRSETAPNMETMSDTNIISADNSEAPIYCWKDGTELKYWAKTKKINAATSLIGLFADYKQLSDISGLSSWNTKDVINMRAIFRNCSSLTDIAPLSSWDTRNVKYIGRKVNFNSDYTGMFENCSSLTSLIGLERWNIENVTDIASLFRGCSKLTDISQLSAWNIENVTDISSIFENCSNISDITPLSSWNTENVTNMSSIFKSCSNISDITPLSAWNTENVTDMSSMFNEYIDYMIRGRGKITDLTPLSSWDTRNVSDMSSMFSDCGKLTDLTPLSSWNTENVTNMSCMFSDCGKLTDLTPLSSWNTENVTDMSSMFNGWRQLTDLTPLSSWDTRNVSGMYGVFCNCYNLTDITPLSSWNTENVTDMTAMFYGCSNLTDLTPLSSWDTRNVTSMGEIFAKCYKLIDIAPLSSWNIENVRSIQYMFENCYELTDLTPLSSWNTQNVQYMRSIFDGCSKLTDLTPLSSWDTGNVIEMNGVFRNCSSLTNLTPLSSWDTGNVQYMGDTIYGGMFENCHNLESLAGLEMWNTGNVRYMRTMFSGCAKLIDTSQTNDWNILNVKNFEKMFYNCPSHPTFTKRAGTWNSEGTFTPAA